MIPVTITDTNFGRTKTTTYECHFAIPVSEYHALQKAGELGDESDHVAICAGQRLVRDNMVWRTANGYTVCGYDTAQEVPASELVYVMLHEKAARRQMTDARKRIRRYGQLIAKYRPAESETP